MQRAPSGTNYSEETIDPTLADSFPASEQQGGNNDNHTTSKPTRIFEV